MKISGGPRRVTDINFKLVHIDSDSRTIAMSSGKCRPYQTTDEIRGLMNEDQDLKAAAAQLLQNNSRKDRWW